MQSFDERQALLRQNSKITDADIEEYKKTEIIRKSIADVKKRAAEQDVIRKSPLKVYANVKSRIAGNMKSQKKAKKTAKYIKSNLIEQSDRTFNSMSPKKTFRPMTSPSKRSGNSPNKSLRSPERMRMIEEQQERLNNLSMEMDSLKQ